MNKIPRILIICLLTIVGYSAFSQKSGSNIYQEILQETNLFRQTKGLPSLRGNDELNKIAQRHSEDMAQGKVSFGHDGFSDRQREAVDKIATLRAFAENVSFGPATGKQVVEGWKNSPGHRRNLLGNYKYVGIGIAADKNGRLYYTQFFGG